MLPAPVQAFLRELPHDLRESALQTMVNALIERRIGLHGYCDVEGCFWQVQDGVYHCNHEPIPWMTPSFLCSLLTTSTAVDSDGDHWSFDPKSATYSYGAFVPWFTKPAALHLLSLA